ncbi:MAG: hypothetical protein ACKVTZ_20300, partial [Bacteroidia bacterium]
ASFFGLISAFVAYRAGYFDNKNQMEVASPTLGLADSTNVKPQEVARTISPPDSVVATPPINTESQVSVKPQATSVTSTPTNNKEKVANKQTVTHKKINIANHSLENKSSNKPVATTETSPKNPINAAPNAPSDAHINIEKAPNKVKKPLTEEEKEQRRIRMSTSKSMAPIFEDEDFERIPSSKSGMIFPPKQEENQQQVQQKR